MKKLLKVFIVGSGLVLTTSTLYFPATVSAHTQPNTEQLPKILNNNTKPPENFNPLTATDSDLLKYGFPKRPTDKKSLANWNDAMKHAKHYVVPDQVASNFKHSISSSNWAGYEVD